MVLIFLVGMLICEGAAAVTGFEWFGTTAEHWPGWAAAGLTFFAAPAPTPVDADA